MRYIRRQSEQEDKSTALEKLLSETLHRLGVVKMTKWETPNLRWYVYGDTLTVINIPKDKMEYIYTGLRNEEEKIESQIGPISITKSEFEITIKNYPRPQRRERK